VCPSETPSDRPISHVAASDSDVGISRWSLSTNNTPRKPSNHYRTTATATATATSTSITTPATPAKKLINVLGSKKPSREKQPPIRSSSPESVVMNLPPTQTYSKPHRKHQNHNQNQMNSPLPRSRSREIRERESSLPDSFMQNDLGSGPYHLHSKPSHPHQSRTTRLPKSPTVSLGTYGQGTGRPSSPDRILRGKTLCSLYLVSGLPKVNATLPFSVLGKQDQAHLFLHPRPSQDVKSWALADKDTSSGLEGMDDSLPCRFRPEVLGRTLGGQVRPFLFPSSSSSSFLIPPPPFVSRITDRRTLTIDSHVHRNPDHTPPAPPSDHSSPCPNPVQGRGCTIVIPVYRTRSFRLFFAPGLDWARGREWEWARTRGRGRGRYMG
jgi:hypothetical protein